MAAPPDPAIQLATLDPALLGPERFLEEAALARGGWTGLLLVAGQKFPEEVFRRAVEHRSIAFRARRRNTEDERGS